MCFHLQELQDIFRIGQRIGEIETHLDYLCNLKAEAELEMLKLQGSLPLSWRENFFL